MSVETVRANATKDFFVNMFTRDIALPDCVLDLVDNSVDGAIRMLPGMGRKRAEDTPYAGFVVRIKVRGDNFEIADNCGGIPVEIAKNRAFCFGRPSNAAEKEHGIGIYGVGLKRALFKIGSLCEVRSSTATEGFVVHIDVANWLTKPDDWTFELVRTEPSGDPGTIISIPKLRPDAAKDFASDAFCNELRRIIARDYSFFLRKGMTVSLNEKALEAYPFELRSGENLQPIHYTYEDQGVRVTITAGLASIPTEALDATDDRAADYFGWFVVCNDRVVVAADKGPKTVWGDNFSVWHPQYNGFMGLAFFDADDPSLLPWSTTKRDVDRTNAVYLRAVERMKTATKQYTAYSTAKKASPDEARLAEESSKPIPIKNLPEAKAMKLPTVATSTYVTVAYTVPKEDVRKVAQALGAPSLSNSKVGLRTFEHFLKNEL